MALQRGTGLIFDTLLQRNLSTIAVIEISEKPNHIIVSFIERNNIFLYFSPDKEDAVYFTSTINLEHIEESKISLLKASKNKSIDAFILDNISPKQVHKNSNGKKESIENAILEHCKNLLSPGGRLAVTWENRWSTQNIRSMIRFRPKRKNKTETVSKNSSWSMQQKIQRAGFNVTSIHAVLPDLESPHRLIATTRSCARLFYEESGSRQYSKLKWLIIWFANRLNIRPHLEPSFVLIARA